MRHATALIPEKRIDKSIVFIRDQRVILDSDLADLYEVSTKALNQAVRRNRDRFPEDFMFQLTREETEELNQKHRDPRFNVVGRSAIPSHHLPFKSNHLPFRP